ncbi:MAG TPA: FAD-dependent oxidoreductase, partial [Syntrophorhabdaceae bacterium]|nr:FAD-dependent oxidoreductase [Syntrophorhabdaceae bacterium]
MERKKEKKLGLVNRREFIKCIGLGASVFAFGDINLANAAILPKAKRGEKFDIIIIGTGFAGLVAGVAAQEKGSKVCIIEKLPEAEMGGNSKLAGGFIAVPKDNSNAAKEEYFHDFMKKSTGKGNATITRVIAEHIADSVHWLKRYKAELTEPLTVAGYQVKNVLFKPGAYQGMPDALKNLKSIIIKNGGKIFFNTKAKQLIINDSGSIIGVRAQDNKGLIDFTGKAVIIATGGYGANKEMLEMFVDPDADEMMVRGVKTATGDGLILAKEAGAMLVNMGGMASAHVAAVSPKNPSAGNPFMAIAYTVGINKNGKRYIDESLGYVANGKAAMRQPGQTVAMIFDENIKKQPGVTAAVKQFERLGIEIVEADTIPELAKKIGVP